MEVERAALKAAELRRRVVLNQLDARGGASSARGQHTRLDALEGLAHGQEHVPRLLRSGDDPWQSIGRLIGPAVEERDPHPLIGAATGHQALTTPSMLYPSSQSLPSRSEPTLR